MPSRMVVFEDVTASWLASALGVASHLGITEFVPRKGGCAVAELAHHCHMSEAALRRLLDVLVSHGYFVYSKGETLIKHNALSRALKPGAAGRFVELQTSFWYRSCFCTEAIIKALREGGHPFEVAQGKPFFSYIGEEPTKEALFADAMAEITRFCGPFVNGLFSLSPGQRVLDVGGGNGELCRVLKSKFPHCEFGVLDILAHDLSDSEITFYQGSFLDFVPPGYDHLILKNILHDWEDEKVLHILENCAAATVKGAELSVVELLLPEPGRPKGAHSADFGVDWNLYCTLGGQERALSHFRRLLQKAGWDFLEARPSGVPFWLLRARRV